MFRRILRDLSPENGTLSLVRYLYYYLAGKLNIKMPIKALCVAAYKETFLR